MLINKLLIKTQLGLMTAGMIGFCATAPFANAKTHAVMFDDFSYRQFSEAQQNGWQFRHETGHPGIKNATWWKEGISFHPDPIDSNNTVMRITAKTDGTAENTRHTQICHKRKYREGTYAARVYFNDAPQYGPDGDAVIQTFYAISPLQAPMDKNYSEMDFEYLPNGGWGTERLALFATSWETFQLTPWTKVNAYDYHIESLQGWNTLVLQVANNTLKYYVNGHLFATHGADVYPEVPMSINFNQWFDPNKLVQSNLMRQYHHDVDWVYFIKDEVVSPRDVTQSVEQLRKNKIAQQDTVPDWQPKQADYCSL
ncbi:glycoside hydrolase family 16 protein [Pseudoalteromonas luteoviolacea]|uniref:glycoside hydrolase family 16 protein n=1 Tax=Pseudoalteromonas luteoviolacea TaxID=43657 RepID=UPI001B386E7B|nr:glycoside hydrolase family 16 protein [Pseudoalteromonas luteoviolacea]MBQ4812261.1 glycoside hydrolase family 16 protein [Pseudoalteromonas luteoviolacea]